MADGISIPHDLVFYIIEHGSTFKDKEGLQVPDARFLHNVALVSRDWCYTARKLEFTSLRVRRSQLSRFDTFLSSPFQTIVSHMRHLTIHGKHDRMTDHYPLTFVLSALTNLPFLETLALHDFMWPVPWEITSAGLTRRLELKRLEVHHIYLCTTPGEPSDRFIEFLSWFSVIDVLVIESVHSGPYQGRSAFIPPVSRRNNLEHFQAREVVLRGCPHESIIALLKRPHPLIRNQRVSLEEFIIEASSVDIQVMAPWLNRLHCRVRDPTDLSSFHQLESLELVLGVCWFSLCSTPPYFNGVLATLPTQLTRLTISSIVAVISGWDSPLDSFYSLYAEMDHLLSRFASKRALTESGRDRDLDLAVSITIDLPFRSGQPLPRANAEARLRDVLPFVTQNAALKFDINCISVRAIVV